MKRAEEFLKENYFDEETGDWFHYDFHEAMEEYASMKQDELIEKICEAEEQDGFISAYMFVDTIMGKQLKDWLKSLK